MKMKDSGVAWIGKIPAGWEVMRLKTVCSNAETGKRPPNDDEEVLSIGGEHIQDGTFCLDNPRYVSADTYRCSKGKISVGDLLVVKDGATIGKCMYVHNMPADKMLLNEHVYRLCVEKYYYYWLESSGVQYWFRSNNMTTAQESIPQNTLYALPTIIPSVNERKAIVDYLDEKTAAIDSRVAVLEQKLAAYKRLKASVINRAVTRGLDSKAKMKDSGVDWIGEIPAGWEVRRIKDSGHLVLGKILSEIPFEGGSLKPYLKSRNVKWFSPQLDSIGEMYFSKSELRDLRLQKGDLVFAEGGEVGKTAYWSGEIPECYIQNSVQKLTCNDAFDSRFVMYVSFELGNSGYYESIVNHVSIMHLTREKLSRIELPFPLIDTQRAIADYLDAECAKIDKAAELVTRKIELYKKLKRSLINEVVTGKRIVS